MLGRDLQGIQRGIAVVLLAWTLTHCGRDRVGTPRLVVTADPTATGESGNDGPFNVSVVGITSAVRVRESLVMDVVYPSTITGELDRRESPYPAVVFVHGGLVSAERYQWLARHIATRGYVVVMPHHALDLAIFETDNAVLSLRAVRRMSQDAQSMLYGAIAPNARTAVMGHSLGGVVAGRQLSTEFDAAALFAAFPAQGDSSVQGMKPVLVLTGSADRRAQEQDVRNGFLTYARPRYYGVITGFNHYDWTDQATTNELASDGPPSADQPAARRALQNVIDRWLDAYLRFDQRALEVLQTRPFDGIERWDF